MWKDIKGATPEELEEAWIFDGTDVFFGTMEIPACSCYPGVPRNLEKATHYFPKPDPPQPQIKG